MTARLWAAALRWSAVGCLGVHDRCNHPRCTNEGTELALDGGPGGLCRDHVGGWS